MLHAGDIVLYGANGGMPITIDGEDFKLMRETDILMLLGRKENEISS